MPRRKGRTEEDQCPMENLAENFYPLQDSQGKVRKIIKKAAWAPYVYVYVSSAGFAEVGAIYFFFFNIEDSWQLFISVAVLGLHFVFPSYQTAPCNRRLITTTLGFMPRERKPDEGDGLFVGPQLGTRLQLQLG